MEIIGQRVREFHVRCDCGHEGWAPVGTVDSVECSQCDARDLAPELLARAGCDTGTVWVRSPDPIGG